MSGMARPQVGGLSDEIVAQRAELSVIDWVWRLDKSRAHEQDQ